MKQTLLLADDSPTIQRLVAQTFAESRFEVVSVSNGDAAIRKLDEVRPVAVLADIYMPGRNGYEVCAFVRAHATLSGIPVVLLVGAFDAFDDEHAAKAGANAHITKPFEAQALLELLQSLVPAPPEEPTSEPSAAAQHETVIIAPPAVTELAAAAAVSAPSIPEIVADPALRAVPPQVPDDDLLGLSHLFADAGGEHIPGTLSEDDIERIADRVMQRVSRDMVEHVAWDVVPGIVEKVLKEESRKTR